ncbi:MAG: hypothetical protein LBN30_09550 [Oscillospiraceae bacterium]|jgi:NADH:ubiquinone oxidoreductase subunit C|nr:hypothetical protein [Oscillospiraceae bacterium]
MLNLKELIFGGRVEGLDTTSREYAGSAQEWLPVKNIVNGVVVTKDRRFVKIIETLPVNFHLKTISERQTAISHFAAYLKIAPRSLQIRIVTQRLDMEEYFAMMRAYLAAETSAECRAYIEDNIAEIADITENELTTHRFFIVFRYEPQMKARNNTVAAIAERLNDEADTARRYLELCGLEVLEPEYADNEVLELLYQVINKKTGRRVRLPEGVYDMVGDVHGVFGARE